MHNRKDNKPLLLSLFLFIILFVFTYPFYRYYIDPDAVAYLTIAKRYASGDWLRAVNGLWSPFSSWLVAICIKCGMDMLLAAHFINGAACICIIGISFILFRRFNISDIILNSLMFCLPIFLIFCHYIQLFADLWQVFFLLCYLLLLTSPSFIHNKAQWVLCGIIGVLAYFSKAYSFFFVVVHLLVTLFILTKQNGLNKRAIIKPYATALLVMFLIMSPWLYALHNKYGVWTLSTASTLNESWFLNGHKNPKAGIDYLIPPPYDNSPCNWEDPYLSEGHLYKPWENSLFILVQIGRTVVAIWQTIIALFQISIFLLPVFIITKWTVLFDKTPGLFNINHKILLWASLIMPLGYLPLHMEARYIWLLAYTGMIFGAIWLNKWREEQRFRRYVMLFTLSFILYPVFSMILLFRNGEETYHEAIEIKQIGLHGSFAANSKPNDPEVIALLTGMQYYEPLYPIWMHEELDEIRLLNDFRKYHIKYFFCYTRRMDGNNLNFYGVLRKTYPIVYQDNKLTVFAFYQ